MDDSGFSRTPDRPVKLLGTSVRYQRFVETSIDTCGPDFIGGSATGFEILSPLDMTLLEKSPSLFGCIIWS